MLPSAFFIKSPIVSVLGVFELFRSEFRRSDKAYGIRILVGKPASSTKNELLFTIQIVLTNKDSVFKLGFFTPPFLDYAYSLFIFAYF